MIKDLAWNAFKKTGNIDAFLELKQIEQLQNNQNNLLRAKGGNKWE